MIKVNISSTNYINDGLTYFEIWTDYKVNVENNVD